MRRVKLDDTHEVFGNGAALDSQHVNNISKIQQNSKRAHVESATRRLFAGLPVNVTHGTCTTQHSYAQCLVVWTITVFALASAQHFGVIGLTASTSQTVGIIRRSTLIMRARGVVHAQACRFRFALKNKVVMWTSLIDAPETSSRKRESPAGAIHVLRTRDASRLV